MLQQENSLDPPHYLSIINIINTAKIERSLQGEILGWDRAAEEMLGFSAQEAIGQKTSLYIPRPICEQEEQAIWEAVSRNSVYYTEKTVRRQKTGDELLSVVAIKAVRSPAGAIIGLVESSIALADVSKIQELCILSIEHSPTGHLLANSQGVILVVNRQVEKMFGYSREELLGQQVEILLPKQFREHHSGYRQQFGQNPAIRQMGAGRDLFGCRKDGTVFPVEIGLASVTTAAGVFVMASIIDIIDRKKAEEFARSNRDLEQFAFIASHDLQAPLRHINAYVTLLAEKYGAVQDEETQKWIKHIVNGTSQMKTLIDDLLAYARICQTQRTLEYVDLNEIVAQLQQLLSAKIAGSKAVVHVEHLPNLLSNPSLLKQLLQNLLENALRFHRPGEPPEIWIKGQKKDEFWEIMVADNGIGIDPKNHERIFGIFQRIDPQNYPDGSGIGLAVCKKICDLLGGQIRLESQLNQGAKFYVTLK